ncbi:MAG: glycoside hydrolase family 9 protein [Ruminococcus sp.]|nr:glycoside hydrolase family 9 protein [Ruminococcus sp.]
MGYHVFRKGLALLTAGLMLSSAAVYAPLPADAEGNLISNGTFDSSVSGWGTYKESGGAATLTADNGRLALNVTNTGTKNYAVQVYYDIIPMYQNGVYHLSYEISSSVDRYVEGLIQLNGGNYQAYTWKGLNITSEPLTVDYTFTMKYETDIMAKFLFNCGDTGTELPEHTIYLDNVVLELVDDSQVEYDAFMPYEPDIMTNQVGYKPESEKIAVFRNVTDETEFSVVNADTKKTVLTGMLYGETEYPGADETDFYGDFSDVTEEGTYYITCGGLDDSYTFTVGDGVYDSLLDDSVRMLYLQRCGEAVEDDDFGHAACHTGLAKVYGTNETIDVSGGWHDAGDYGRYVVPGAKSIADLLYAYAAAPELYSDHIGIPESGNGVPDVLDEVRYELEWMLKMQAESGGVYHKVTCENFPGYVMPQFETGQLIATPVSTTATADFCASMAMGYEFYYDIDRTFAETCLAAAEKAWAFLEENPDLIFDNPEDITTGEYGDSSDRDERYWAAAQMYRATGEEVYKTAFDAMIVCRGMDWTTVGDYGNIAILTMDGIDKTSTAYKKCLNSVTSQAKKLAGSVEEHPYGISVTSFNWGSNMTIANAGVILGLGYELTGNSEYSKAAESILSYLLGRNPNGVCYVTGYGTVSPQNPHHRPSMAMKQSMKGMLVGGVNQNLDDSAAKAYLASVPAAKRYVDHSESYSTNEITIYWNSPLTYLLSLTETEEDVWQPGDVNADGTFSIADAVLMQKFLLGQKELVNQKAGNVCEDYDINVLDLSVMKEMLRK